MKYHVSHILGYEGFGMSFYSLMRGRYPELTEGAVADKLGISLSTLRSHRTSSPTIRTIINIAEHIDEDPVALLAEFVKREEGGAQ